MSYELLLDYIRPELLVLVIGLYFIGMAFKSSTYVNDELIPFILGIISIVLCALYIFAVTDITGGYKTLLIALFEIIIQGILCAAGSVYINQLFKQSQKLKALDVPDDE